MNLKNFVSIFEESEIVKYFSEKDWDKYKGEDCTICRKAFEKESRNDKEQKDEKHDEQVVSDVKGNLYHLKCFNKRFNPEKDLHLNQKDEHEYHYK